jgi:hypothetical protein
VSSRRSARRFAAPACAAIALVVATSAVAGAVTDTSVPTPDLTGNAAVTVGPVPSGEVAVVAESAPVRNRVAFVVENGSDASVRIAKVTGFAERSSRTQATRASTTDVVPLRLAPGERAIGQVAFPRGTIDVAPSLTWNVRSTRAPSTPDPTRLAISDLVLSGPQGGAVAQTLAFTATNPQTRALRGPVVTKVLCVNEAGVPAVLAAATTSRATLRPGADRAVTVKLRELCPSYVVAARVGPAR